MDPIKDLPQPSETPIAYSWPAALKSEWATLQGVAIMGWPYEVEHLPRGFQAYDDSSPISHYHSRIYKILHLVVISPIVEASRASLVGDKGK